MGDSGLNSTAFEDREEQLANFYIENVSVCVIRFDQDGCILNANKKACESLGYSRSELLRMSVFDIDPKANQESWSSIWQKICKNGSFTIESEHRRKDGTVFPIEVTATLIEFEGRRYAVGLIKDITERRRVSKTLRLAQFIFEKASVGIFLIRWDGSIALINEHACNYLGYSRDELLGMNITEIDHVYSLDDRDYLMERLRKTGCDRFESVHRCKDGEMIPVAVTSNLIDLNKNQYSVSFVQDITEQKKVEKQRLKMEAYMRQAQKMESLGTLAGGIAHDFNNILAAIAGFAELAQFEAPKDSYLYDCIGQISQASRRAKNLVNQILAFSRQGPSEKRPSDVSRPIAEALKLLKATLPKTIQIRQNIPSGLAPVVADEGQIHQIAMNLGTNAYHAMKSSGGVLDASLSAVTIGVQDLPNYPGLNPGDFLSFSVADTGCGIAPDQIERIFEPYYTTKPAGEGTGMGLSTVHGIVKDHGGFIKVYSELGSGTNFQVLLPAAGSLTGSVFENPPEITLM